MVWICPIGSLSWKGMKRNFNMRHCHRAVHEFCSCHEDLTKTCVFILLEWGAFIASEYIHACVHSLSVCLFVHLFVFVVVSVRVSVCLPVCLIHTLFFFIVFLSLSLSLNRLVIKASASRMEGPGFESRLRRDFFGVESYQWLKNWHSSGYSARRLAI